MKATLVKPGSPFSIVENTASKRKTETMLTIGKEQRSFGADSLLDSGKYPKETFQEVQRLFGQKYDTDFLKTLQDHYFLTNELVTDQRNQVAWKITKPASGDDAAEDQIIYSEEVVGMLLGYVRMLAEIQAESTVRDCVITVPAWFSYEQRQMMRDAAEGLAGLHVLAMVEENTAAAVMLGIEKKLQPNESETVIFYNMGGMDTEVTIARYSVANISEKKSAPQIEILG
jgi:molecular chaperone DnaK (HSP70)